MTVIAGLIGFDLATVKRHIMHMRAIGDLPPSTRAPRKLPPKKHCTAPRLLPEDVQDLRGIIMDLELKIQSLQTPPRPCPAEWHHVAAEWDRLERLRQQTGAALPTIHRPTGFVEATLRKNHTKEP